MKTIKTKYRRVIEMMHKRFWFDVETTGLHYYDNEIISLSYLVEIDGKVVERGSMLARPDNFESIEDKALQINRYSIDFLKSIPMSQKDLFNNVVSVLETYPITNKESRFVTAGYNNSGCDTIFLQQLFLRHCPISYGFFKYFKSIKLDVFTLFPIIEEKLGIQFSSHTLSDIAKQFKMEHNPHDSLSDIIVTYKLYKIFMNVLNKH
jgi:DNA polymerase III epsilon subunit-like protein